MKFYILLALSTLLSACVWPQTSEEFMSSMGEGRKNIVNKPFATVVKNNNKLFKECFNVIVVVRSRTGGTNNTYTPKISKGNKSVIYSLQMAGTAYINTGYPEDGMYLFSAKVEKMSKNKTKITTYAMWNLSSDNIQTAFHEWSKGTSTECPSVI